MFELQGPDDNGDVWIVSAEGAPEKWGHNLGPLDEAADEIARWLASVDYEERKPLE